MALVFRRAEEADADAVRALTRRAYAQWVPLIGREPLPMTADHGRAIREERVDLAIADAALVGLVHVVLRPDDLLVENLAVDPACRGRGFGTALLRHAERLATDAGRSMVRLYTNGLFAENLRLYATRGYEVEREEPFRGGFVVHLRKSLDAAPG